MHTLAHLILARNKLNQAIMNLSLSQVQLDNPESHDAFYGVLEDISAIQHELNHARSSLVGDQTDEELLAQTLQDVETPF